MDLTPGWGTRVPHALGHSQHIKKKKKGPTVFRFPILWMWSFISLILFSVFSFFSSILKFHDDLPLPRVCFFIIVAIIVFCSATPHILRDLGSLTRDGTCAPCSGSALTTEPSGNSHGFFILFWHFVTLFWKCTMLNSRKWFFHFCNEILFYHSFISIVFIFFLEFLLVVGPPCLVFFPLIPVSLFFFVLLSRIIFWVDLPTDLLNFYFPLNVLFSYIYISHSVLVVCLPYFSSKPEEACQRTSSLVMRGRDFLSCFYFGEDVPAYSRSLDPWRLPCCVGLLRLHGVSLLPFGVHTATKAATVLAPHYSPGDSSNVSLM